MIHGSENSTAIQSLVTGATAEDEVQVDPELFTKELSERLQKNTSQKPTIHDTMERLATSLQGVSISQGDVYSAYANASTFSMQAGTNQTVTLTPAMLTQMGQSEDMYQQIEASIRNLLAAANQPLINTGAASVTKNLIVDTQELRVVEVQRDAKGSSLSVASLALQNDEFITDTLDRLLADRNGGSTGRTATTRGGQNSVFQFIAQQQNMSGSQSSTSGSGGWSILDQFLTTSSNWRFQATVSAPLMGQLMEQRSSSVMVNVEVALQQYTEAGGAESGVDLWTYMEMMGLCDPLVFDLGDEGINLTSAEDGVYFDIKGDGTPVKTAFIQGNNAFLYLDENGNGVVDDANELFGDHAGHANGFEKLRQYDDNGDGVIDEKDAIYSQLRLWRDLNGDGINQLEESLTLAEAGIKSINLNYDNTRTLDKHGNVIGERSSFTRTDGTEGLVADAWVRYLK